MFEFQLIRRRPKPPLARVSVRVLFGLNPVRRQIIHDLAARKYLGTSVISHRILPLTTGDKVKKVQLSLDFSCPGQPFYIGFERARFLTTPYPVGRGWLNRVRRTALRK